MHYLLRTNSYSSFFLLLSTLSYTLHKSSTVMTFLFGSGKTFQEKIRTVAKLALEHSSNLAAFAGLYKASTI